MAINSSTVTRVLVTGGAGFIGSHVVDRLIADGYEVTVLDSLVPQVHGTHEPGWWPAWSVAAQGRGATHVRGDVRDREAVLQLLTDWRPDCVVHLAAEVGVGQAEVEIERYVDANVRGTAVLLDAILRANDSADDEEARGVRRLIVAGSMSAYGEGAWACATHGHVRPRRSVVDLVEGRWDPRCPFAGHEAAPCPTPELQPAGTQEWAAHNPTGVYAATKRDQEDYALLVGANRGLSVAVPRFFNVLGPRQALRNPYTGVTAIFGARVRMGLRPRVYEDGRQVRDFVHVSDAAAAVVHLIGSWQLRRALRVWSDPAWVGPFNVGTGLATSVLDVAEAACVGVGNVLWLGDTGRPDVTPHVTGEYRTGDTRACVADPGRLTSLGWSPRVSVADGLAALYAEIAVAPVDDLPADPEAAHEQACSAGVVQATAATTGQDAEASGPTWTS